MDQSACKEKAFMANTVKQLRLFSTGEEDQPAKNASTFVDNMKLPVHRWFRYSAGFSAQWVESIIRDRLSSLESVSVFDPFAGSGTTLLAAQDAGASSIGVESHPFIYRVARAKVARQSNPKTYRHFARRILESAQSRTPSVVDGYPPLIDKCYKVDALTDLDRLRTSLEDSRDESTAYELTWLTLVGILRRTSHVGTANWQYVLPKKSKKATAAPFAAFEEQIEVIYRDMMKSQRDGAPRLTLLAADARTCGGVPDDSVNLVITSPPYPNNYDYADATRLEMCFMREISGWGDLHDAVRRHLVRSCSQHVPEKAVNLKSVLAAPELAPIRDELVDVCETLSQVRLTKGGKKTYHLMVACYFLDLAQVWITLRRVCQTPSEVCFVIGDSAPYGVYVPVMDWMGKLAISAGFREFHFEKLRDRNLKWKNRKHRVPLCEGYLWVKG
jgi:hypothetical protein